VVLDPFFGTGTTGAVAKRLQRHYVGIEADAGYAQVARARIDAIAQPQYAAELLVTTSKRTQPRVTFGDLVAAGYLHVGQTLVSADGRHTAVIKADAHVVCAGHTASIHRAAAAVQGKPAFNGWEFWYIPDGAGGLLSIDALRDQYRRDAAAASAETANEEPA